MPEYPGGTDPLLSGMADMIRALFDEDKIPMNADFNMKEISDLMKLKMVDRYFVQYYMTKEEYEELLMEGGISKIDILIRDYGKFKIGKSRQGRKELIEGLKALFSSKKGLKESLTGSPGG